MGIEKFVEEAAGAFAADKALEAVDPNAGFIAKAAAAVAGFEGAGALGDAVSGLIKKEEQPASQQADSFADAADQQFTADAADDSNDQNV